MVILCTYACLPQRLKEYMSLTIFNRRENEIIPSLNDLATNSDTMYLHLPNLKLEGVYFSFMVW